MPGGPGRVSNVVFMGMGEPLANYPSVLTACGGSSSRRPTGLGISQRAVTVSTVGLVPAIRKLADEGLPVRLAVSLHAPDDELRDTLVPVNRRWKVAEVLDAAWGYAAATGRRVSIEYAMIRDINDQAWRADLLASLLAGRLAHVNLIPLNPTPGSKWTASDPDVAARVLRPAGLARHPGDGARYPGNADRRRLRPAGPPLTGVRPNPTGTGLTRSSWPGCGQGTFTGHDVEARARQAAPRADAAADPGAPGGGCSKPGR